MGPYLLAGLTTKVLVLLVNLARETAISGANVPEYLFLLAHVSASR